MHPSIGSDHVVWRFHMLHSTWDANTLTEAAKRIDWARSEQVRITKVDIVLDALELTESWVARNENGEVFLHNGHRAVMLQDGAATMRDFVFAAFGEKVEL